MADVIVRQDGTDPEHEAVLADSVGFALLVVLETLTAPERLAFVLHDMFAMQFHEIPPIVGRALRPPHGSSQAGPAAAFDALLTLLDPDVVLRADPTVVRSGAAAEVCGAAAVAGTFSGRARAAQPALVNGAVGLVWAPGR